MNKLDHLKQTKSFLKKVVRFRRELLKAGKGKSVTPLMWESMPKIEYWAENINNFDRMVTYINRKDIQVAVTNMIPSNKHIWVAEFQGLIMIGNNLNQPAKTAVTQTEIKFKINL